MTHLIPANLPVFFQCLRLPVAWYRAAKSPRLFGPLGKAISTRMAPDLLAVVPETIDAILFDPWQKRNEFLRLEPGDSESLLKFLPTVGLFEPAGLKHKLKTKGYAGGEVVTTIAEAHDASIYEIQYLETISQKRIWEMRTLLQESLRKLPRWTRQHDDFHCRIVREKARPRVIITTTTFMQAMMLTLTIDCVKGARVRKCARPDCGILFSIASGHKRKYCGWYCGHIQSVRKSRKKIRRQKGNTVRKAQSVALSKWA